MADGDCSHEIKRCLLLGRKAMPKLDSVLKSRDIPLPTKVHIVRAMVFLVVMYGCEIWNIKKIEHWRIDAFELCCWRRLLRVPWTAKSSRAQSILKEINPEYSLEGLMLKLQYFGHLMQSQLIGKDPDAGKDWKQEVKGTTEYEMVEWHHWLNGHKFEQAPGDGEGQGNLACCSPWGHKQTRQSDWIITVNKACPIFTTWGSLFPLNRITYFFYGSLNPQQMLVFGFVIISHYKPVWILWSYLKTLLRDERDHTENIVFQL